MATASSKAATKQERPEGAEDDEEQKQQRVPREMPQRKLEPVAIDDDSDFQTVQEKKNRRRI